MKKNHDKFPGKRPRSDRNSYTRVYDDQVIDATTTFEGNETIVTTVTKDMLCKNLRCENIHAHVPKNCPYKKQNF